MAKARSLGMKHSKLESKRSSCKGAGFDRAGILPGLALAYVRDFPESLTSMPRSASRTADITQQNHNTLLKHYRMRTD